MIAVSDDKGLRSFDLCVRIAHASIDEVAELLDYHDRTVAGNRCKFPCLPPFLYFLFFPFISFSNSLNSFIRFFISFRSNWS